jgi:hypothetical protein
MQHCGGVRDGALLAGGPEGRYIDIGVVPKGVVKVRAHGLFAFLIDLAQDIAVQVLFFLLFVVISSS